MAGCGIVKETLVCLSQIHLAKFSYAIQLRVD